MGEELLAFRDTRGRVGVIDQHCPHRGANLWLGRNEDCGIRCVYHGWKFDTDGRCVDMPTSYPDLNAKDKIRIKAYPAREQGGMIWAYMGPAERMPKLPALEVALVPASHRYVSKKWQDCNWVQAMEGSIDTAHFSFAHLTFDKEEDEDLDISKHLASPMSRMSFDHVRWIADDPRPVIKVNPHDAGLTIAGGRIARDDNIYWRIAQFLMPVHAYAPSAMPGENMFGQIVRARHRHQLLDLHLRLEPGAADHRPGAGDVQGGNGVIAEVDENYVPLRHKGNDYLIDRQLQKTRSYTGIKGVSEQDAAVQDSQGPIADRTREHLGPTDLGILRFRKLVMDCARDLQRGEEPEAALMRRPLRRPRRRLGHAQEQGPRHRDGGALRRSGRLCGRSPRRRRSGGGITRTGADGYFQELGEIADRQGLGIDGQGQRRLLAVGDVLEGLAKSHLVNRTP